MRRAYTCFSSLVLSAALLIPATTIATPRGQDDRDHHDDNQRVYDAEHKDYHNWNKDEDQQWKQYLKNQHSNYHDYSKADKKEQASYWNWRHDQGNHH
jgi:hypothetical protein